MTKTQRMLAAIALAGAAAGLAAPAASAAPVAPLTLPDLPSAAPGMQPTSVQEIGGQVSAGANQLNRLAQLPDDLAPVIAPVQPLTDLAGAIQ
ncbi:hypothetical protein AB0D66_03255 [Streptomyces sp. NPDC048270]|uniref:hypothetical protein n=1 Tax=Streptomyces sp. NPDC048270 TaxID=3154615 RepID=UPI0033D14F50